MTDTIRLMLLILSIICRIDSPFRVHTIQTDNGHEFRAKFHLLCEYLGIRHVFIKPASLHLNDVVERSHHTDKTKFYQLIEYTDNVDIAKKLSEWDIF